jgi:chorismate mutase
MEKKPDLQISPELLCGTEKGRPFVIAGPCSAESEEQVLNTAMAVSKIPNVHVFRAGVWKPRTRPKGFEGVGSAGLGWLKKVKQQTSLLTAVEVANERHVFEALKYDVDVLWIGARTTVNLFAVQEIANALRGADIPVWVKNPINPDIQLWIGALERLNEAGVTRLGAIHRGFSTYENTPYRNVPRWDIAIELKRLAPRLPLLCDPSHIAGKTELLRDIAQRALDLSMNGLMIETHIDPGAALSDAAQQISPETLGQLLNRLQVRKTNGGGPALQEPLESLRQQSNVIDHELLEILARRMEVVKKIGEYKKARNMAILQVKRWEQVLEDRVMKGGQFGMEEGFIKDIYEILHNYAIKLQSAIINDEAPDD